MKETVACDRTLKCEKAMATGEREELIAAGWVPCSRKGGKTAWICPACDPSKGPPPGRSRTTI